MVSSSGNETVRSLLEFKAEQKRFEIGDITVGGQPGVRPTVLIGTIFYHGHKIIVDEHRGEFRRTEAQKLIRAQEEYSERTGNPCMLDVVGASPEAIQRHLEFAASVTKMPLLIDGTTVDVRLAGLKYVSEAGLAQRAVYNSIQPGIGDEELHAIREAGVESALILSYYMKDFTSRGRMKVIKELVPKAQQAGIRNLMIDTCVLDLATLGQALGAVFSVKDELGLPAGGGVHNAIHMWRGLKGKMGEHAYNLCIGSAVASAVSVGADFALYGPIEGAKHVFPPAAMMDTAFSQLLKERGEKPDQNHPRFRIG
ncbi:MAG: tetrahydromethanopterin S-methyltransferase subunit H [Acidobacteriota bacterium]